MIVNPQVWTLDGPTVTDTREFIEIAPRLAEALLANLRREGFVRFVPPPSAGAVVAFETVIADAVRVIGQYSMGTPTREAGIWMRADTVVADATLREGDTIVLYDGRTFAIGKPIVKKLPPIKRAHA